MFDDRRRAEVLKRKLEERDSKIEMLERMLEIERKKVRDEKTKFFRLEAFIKTHPLDQSYVAYLRDELRICEEMYAQSQTVIQNYRDHYKKYGTFYTDWEESVKAMLAQCAPADGSKKEKPSEQK